MQVAQREQQAYNQPVQPREFQLGDRVILLLPSSTCKFLAFWEGPYTITEKVSPVNYYLQ